MRILATAGRRLGRTNDVENSYMALIAALRASGDCWVEEGFVADEQDLSHYDLVLVEVPHPSKVDEDRFNGCMWALSQETAPAAAIYDHWEIDKLHHAIDKTIATGYDSRSMMATVGIQNVLSHTVHSALHAFPWGSRHGIGWASWLFDPSMFLVYPMTYMTQLQDRERKWVFASYQHHKEWLKDPPYGWPVEAYGLKAHGRATTTLAKLMPRYQACWGAAIPPYPGLVGTGYYRSRYVYMAQSRSLFWMDDRDAAAMDPIFVGHYEEEPSPQDLNRRCELQSEWFFANVWKQEKFIEEAMGFARRVGNA